LVGVLVLLLTLLGITWYSRPRPTPRRVPVNAALPVAAEFKLTDLAGRQLDSARLKGHVVVLDLWATWCAPLYRGHPDVQQVAGEVWPSRPHRRRRRDAVRMGAGYPASRRQASHEVHDRDRRRDIGGTVSVYRAAHDIPDRQGLENCEEIRRHDSGSRGRERGRTRTRDPKASSRQL